MSEKRNRYQAVIEEVFFSHYEPGKTRLEFRREELSEAARKLDIKAPKNLGDIIYSVRYRSSLPDRITATSPEEMEWVIEGAGRGKYAFRLTKIHRLEPSQHLLQIKIPDSTPEIVLGHTLSDEQALLARLRYNRLIDIFLGMTAYSLQNHLRTTVQNVGQIEIDELYVGLDTGGRQFIVPVQAKGGNDQLSAIQTRQDIGFCTQRFPQLICRPVSAQFMRPELIALFELAQTPDGIRVVQEKHYCLTESRNISESDLTLYRSRSD